MTTDAHQADTSVATGWLKIVQWLVMSAVVLTAMALAAAHLPSRIKLLVLFTMAYGLLAAWMLAWLSRVTNVSRGRPMSIVSCLLIAATCVGMVFESHRLYAADKLRLRKQNPAALMGNQLLKSSEVPADVKESFRQAEQEQQQLRSFPGYLRYRVSSLGLWSHPWPALFWGFEVILASLTGGWLFGRVA